MSRDLHTPNVEAAAAHAAHHAHPDDRPGWDIHPADVDFPCDPPICPGCNHDDCLMCAFRRVFRKDTA